MTDHRDAPETGAAGSAAPAGAVADLERRLAAAEAECERLRTLNTALEKNARLEGELKAARGIQQLFIPREKPSIPGIDLMGLYKPAYEIGGDYLDYFQTRDGEWIVVVADVSGKGVPAALLMTMLRSSFRTEAQKQVTAKQLLCDVNAIFYKHSDGKSFATAICCIINAEGTAMTYARAGHPPMIKIPRDSKRPQHIKTAGVAIGMLDKDEFAAKLEEHTIYFQEGERYFVFSDGLSEARAQDGGFYGVGRVETLLAGDDSTTAEGIISRVAEDVKTFCTGAPVSDDLTLVAMVVNKKIPFWRRMTERMRRYAFSVEQWTEDENR